MKVVCHYCDRLLPEPGHTHYAIVETMLKDAVPACVACRKRMGAKLLVLRRKEPT